MVEVSSCMFCVQSFVQKEGPRSMGVQPHIIPFPGGERLVTRTMLERELARLREELLPYYEDEVDALDVFVDNAKGGDAGAFGIMRAIGKCHEEIGLYHLLNLNNEESDEP